MNGFRPSCNAPWRRLLMRSWRNQMLERAQDLDSTGLVPFVTQVNRSTQWICSTRRSRIGRRKTDLSGKGWRSFGR